MKNEVFDMSKKFVDYSEPQENVVISVDPSDVVAEPDVYHVGISYINEKNEHHYKFFDVSGDQVTHGDDHLLHVDLGAPDTDIDGMTAGALKTGVEAYERARYPKIREYNLPFGNYDDPSQFRRDGQLPALVSEDEALKQSTPGVETHIQVNKDRVRSHYDEEFGSVSTVYFPIRANDWTYTAEVRVPTQCVHQIEDSDVCDVDLGSPCTGHDVLYDEDEYNREFVAYDVPAANIVALNEAAKTYEKEHPHDNERGHEFDADLAAFEEVIENGTLPF